VKQASFASVLTTQMFTPPRKCVKLSRAHFPTPAFMISKNHHYMNPQVFGRWIQAKGFFTIF